MKHIRNSILILISLFALQSGVYAQRVGSVDSKGILEKIPEYKTAEQEVEALSKKWQSELDGMYAKIDKMYQAYETEKPLLSADLQRKKEDEIIAEEKKAKEFQKKKFGYDGELFKTREEKVKPIQDKVYKAIEDVAKEKRIDFMFDKSGAVTLLFANPDYDYTDQVLKKLAVK